MYVNGNGGKSSFNEMDDMLEEDSDALSRIQELERKVIEQGDEIVCLRATLADALRRLSQLEGLRPSNTPVHQRNGISSPISHREYRIRQPILRASTASPSGESSRDAKKRASSYVPSSLPQRRAVHYQSTSSLHSDSPSSNSVSPVPSPSPRITASQQQTVDKVPGHSSPSSSFALAKRWNSTGDFVHPHSGVNSPIQSRFSTKSLLNLYSKPGQNHLNYKHGSGQQQTQ